MAGGLRMESPDWGSRMMRGRSGRPELGDRTSGAGLLLSRRFWVREVGEGSLELESSRELVRE